jgi:hypothetical protein
MNTMENQARDSACDESAAAKKSQRVNTVAWLAGITAVVALLAMSESPSVGMGLGVIGVCGMVAFVCYMLLRDR